MNEKDSKLTEKSKECFYRKELSEQDWGWMSKNNIFCYRRSTLNQENTCNSKNCLTYSLAEISGIPKIKYQVSIKK